jgi:hypothetical protein
MLTAWHRSPDNQGDAFDYGLSSRKCTCRSSSAYFSVRLEHDSAVNFRRFVKVHRVLLPFGNAAR